MQLSTYGDQDVYLTGQPQLTYFRSAYKRYTNFAMESMQLPFNSQPGFGRKVTAIISKNMGFDLLYNMDVRIELPAVPAKNGESFRWLNWLGHIIIDYVEISIAGQIIDRHYGHWLHIWNELTQTAGHQAGYARGVGNVPRLVQATTGDVPSVVLYVPLQFWFNRNPGLALPIIALQYYDVAITIQFADAAKCYWNPGGTRTQTTPDFDIQSVELWANCIFLDGDERRKFAQSDLEYMIEQVQFNGAQQYIGPQSSINYKMAFNHPVKEIIWTMQKDSVVDSTATADYGGPQWFNYSDALDYTYFSGTPSDPLGGGIGTAAFGGSNWPHNMPLSGTANSNIISGAGNISSLNFNDLFGNASFSDTRGWTAQLPIFDSGENPTALAKIKLGTQDRFREREGFYFNNRQPYYHHTNCPAIGINVYSFALLPEEQQPSGACNFTRIDTSQLLLSLTDATMPDSSESAKLRVYAVNYNILRIKNGMGGLAFNN